jgi:hypothetical protein
MESSDADRIEQYHYGYNSHDEVYSILTVVYKQRPHIDFS